MPQMPKVELYAAIRRDYRHGMKLREIARKHNVSWRTIRKAVDSLWPEPRKKLPPRPTAMDPYKAVIDGILQADLDAPRKQRHTVTRIFHRLVEEHGAEVSYQQVRRYVADRKPQILVESGKAPIEAFVPQTVVASKADFGIDLVTPLQAGSSRQGRENLGYQRDPFAIDWDQRQAVCPQGRTSRFWSPSTQQGREVIVVRFDEADCHPCPGRTACTTAKRWGRRLTLRPRALHELAQANHDAQNDQAWQAKYALRAGVEGTVRQALAVTGSRRTRYRGLAKTHLEHVYSAVALNLIRLDAWWNDKPLDHTRTSHLS
ncbi:transposase [Kitasatospora sp. NPDC056783]|uniref:transposase n=1 Tax=Kitasatospora sp. NPDC056783 TaxID=3345943 RepID=UPI0036CC2D6B